MFMYPSMATFELINDLFIYLMTLLVIDKQQAWIGKDNLI